MLAEALFDEVLFEWLKDKLADGAEEDGAIAVLAKDDPLGVVERIRELAILRRDHRTATVPSVWVSRPSAIYRRRCSVFSVGPDRRRRAGDGRPDRRPGTARRIYGNPERAISGSLALDPAAARSRDAAEVDRPAAVQQNRGLEGSPWQSHGRAARRRGGLSSSSRSVQPIAR